MLRSGFVVAILLFLGRISGFVREWWIAQAAGASDATDVAIVLLTFPDLAVNLLIAGGITAALVPAFKRLPPEVGSALLVRTAVLVGAAFFLLAALLSVAAVPTLAAIAPGLSGRIDVDTVELFRLVSVALPLTAVSGVVVAFLNARERFSPGASGTLVLNVAIILFILFDGENGLAKAIAYGVVAGCLARLLMQLISLKSMWTRPKVGSALADADIVSRFIGSFGFFSLLFLMPPIARAFASVDEAGALSLFNFAHKLIELPMALVVGAITTVMLPHLSDRPIADVGGAPRVELRAILRGTAIVLLAIAIPSSVYADTMVRIVFFSSPFTDAQMHTLVSATALGLAGLPFQGLLMIQATAFTAFSRTRPLVIAGVLMLALQLVSSAAMQPAFGTQGVMASYVLAMTGGAVFLSVRMSALFGINVLSVLARNGFAAILIPSTVSLAIALAGKGFNLDPPAEVLFAATAFLALLGLHVAFDQTARNLVLAKFRPVK